MIGYGPLERVDNRESAGGLTMRVMIVQSVNKPVLALMITANLGMQRFGLLARSIHPKVFHSNLRTIQIP